MTSLVRALAGLFILQLTVAGHLFAELQVQGDYQGKTYRIRHVRVNEPMVMVDGKREEAADLRSVVMVTPKQKYLQTKPGWVYLDLVKATATSMLDTESGQSFNRELFIKMKLESPVAMKNVFLVFYLESTRGDKGMLIQEVGTVVPFSWDTVAVKYRYDTSMGDFRYQVHVFANGVELMHNYNGVQYFHEQIVTAIAAQTLLEPRKMPEAWLTFAPRDIRERKQKVTVALKLSSVGMVNEVSVSGDLAKKEVAAIEEAASKWYFVPGSSVPEGKAFNITLDLEHLKDWSKQDFTTRL